MEELSKESMHKESLEVAALLNDCLIDYMAVKEDKKSAIGTI